MTSAVFAVLAACTLSYVAYGLYASRCRKQTSRLRALRVWQTRFQRAVEVLATKEHVPVSVLKSLLVLNEMIGRQNMPRYVAVALTRAPLNSGRIPLMQDIDPDCPEHERAEIHGLFSRAMYAGMLSLTYSDYRGGDHARAVLAVKMAEASASRSYKPSVAYVRRVNERYSARDRRHGWFSHSPETAQAA